MKHRPNKKAMVIGISLMIIGILCWFIKMFSGYGTFLIPLGLLLLCCGGLTLTVAAFIALRKNDIAENQRLRELKKRNSHK